MSICMCGLTVHQNTFNPSHLASLIVTYNLGLLCTLRVANAILTGDVCSSSQGLRSISSYYLHPEVGVIANRMDYREYFHTL